MSDMQDQLNIPAPGQAVTIEQVLASLARLRVHPQQDEYKLQAAISEQLTRDGILHKREHSLGQRRRIDFLVPGARDGIGIEVKKGKPNATAVAAQVARYCESAEIGALIIVVERSLFTHAQQVQGKPVHYWALSKNWGIAL